MKQSLQKRLGELEKRVKELEGKLSEQHWHFHPSVCIPQPNWNTVPYQPYIVWGSAGTTTIAAGGCNSTYTTIAQ